METLLSIDRYLFYSINNGLSNPVFDVIMPVITEFKFWLPIYILMFAWLLWKGGKKGRIAAILLIVGVVLTDQIASSIIKQMVGRIRPCSALFGVHSLVPCGGGKAFPSSHAANNFGAAMILACFYKSKSWIFFSLAFLIAFSRVYVGVHYPLDVFGGAVLGVVIGLLLVYGYKLLMYVITRKDKINLA